MIDSEPEGLPVCLEVACPGDADPQFEPTWTISAYNKNVLAGWKFLCQNTPQNAVHCYDWLAKNPMVERGRRCFALRGKRYAGSWCYEIGSGDRIYYKPDLNMRKVKIWHAGRHPKNRIPIPPRDI